MKRVWIAATVIGGLAGGPVIAQDETTAARWLSELRENRERLLAGDLEPARVAAQRQIQELISMLKGGGPPANELASAALVQLALAEAGLAAPGASVDDAAWHLEVATLFNPAFAQAEFAEFGAAGARLEAARRARAAADPDPRQVLPIEPAAGLEPPRMIDSPHMVFRASREVLQAFDLALHVAFVVDREGRVRRLAIEGRLDNPAPVLLSLELLRSWKFAPARLSGNPVAVHYALDLPLTEAAVGRAGWDLKLWRIASLLAGEELRSARTAAEELLSELEAASPSLGRDAARTRALEYLDAVEVGLRG
jgi:hypothetical protein